MNSWVIRSIVVAAALFMNALLPAEAKTTKSASDAAVQTLANFPALQRLAAKSKGKVIRNFLREVSAEYREAGYGAFAQALPQAASLIALFGKPETAEDAGTLKHARAALRHLQGALAKNPRIALPKAVGDTIPDYLGIATAFHQNAARALKNLAAGKNVANFLRKTPPPFLVTKIDETHFGVEGTSASIGSLTISGAGKLVLSGTNTFTGATTISAGKLVIGNLSGSLSAAELRPGGSLDLGGAEGYRWVAFPPEVEIPSEWSALPKITFSSAITTGAETFASGTRVIKAPVEFPLPTGAYELPANATLTVPLTTDSFAGGTLQVATPTPSPTPAE